MYLQQSCKDYKLCKNIIKCIFSQNGLKSLPWQPTPNVSFNIIYIWSLRERPSYIYGSWNFLLTCVVRTCHAKTFLYMGRNLKVRQKTTVKHLDRRSCLKSLKMNPHLHISYHCYQKSCSILRNETWEENNKLFRHKQAKTSDVSVTFRATNIWAPFCPGQIVVGRKYTHRNSLNWCS